MPIIDLQRRMRQLGEIRIGQVVPTKNGKTRPDKLSTFRFTSPSHAILDRVAADYGGDVAEWNPANGAPSEWEVVTTTDRVPVVIPPQAVSQWYELYQGSKCVRRCDGQMEQKSDRACMCDPEARDCSLTTRLNVMLRNVPPIGVWLLTTRGYYAALELPAVAELLQRGGGNIAGWLSLEERRIVREDGETNRFMVPTLDIDMAPAQLLAGQSGITPAVDQPQPRQAIEPGNGEPSSAGEGEDFFASVAACTTLDQLTAVLRRAQQAGLAKKMASSDDKLVQAFIAKREELQNGKAAQPTAAEPSADELWMQIVAATPDGWTTSDLESKFSERNGGVMPSHASAQQLDAFLHDLRTGWVNKATTEEESVPF